MPRIPFVTSNDKRSHDLTLCRSYTDIRGAGIGWLISCSPKGLDVCVAFHGIHINAEKEIQPRFSLDTIC